MISPPAQVADVQNKQKLAEVQATIDISGLERMPDHPITAEYRVRQSSYTVPTASFQLCRCRSDKYVDIFSHDKSGAIV